MKKEAYCRAGQVELSEIEAFRIYNNQLYICTSTAIYQAHFRPNQPQQIAFTKICTYKGIAARGRWLALSASRINELMGFEYLHTNY